MLNKCLSKIACLKALTTNHLVMSSNPAGALEFLYFHKLKQTSFVVKFYKT